MITRLNVLPNVQNAAVKTRMRGKGVRGAVAVEGSPLNDDVDDGDGDGDDDVVED